MPAKRTVLLEGAMTIKWASERSFVFVDGGDDDQRVEQAGENDEGEEGGSEEGKVEKEGGFGGEDI